MRLCSSTPVPAATALTPVNRVPTASAAATPRANTGRRKWARGRRIISVSERAVELSAGARRLRVAQRRGPMNSVIPLMALLDIGLDAQASNQATGLQFDNIRLILLFNRTPARP